MIRFVIVSLLLSLLVYMVYVKLFKKPKTKEQDYTQQSRKQQDGSIMMACPKCGTYTETIDSIAVDGKFFCSRECAGVR